MKIRTGFVSNSSSSSFVLYTKGELTEDRVKEILLGKTVVDPDCLLAGLFNDLYAKMVKEIDFSKYQTLAEYSSGYPTKTDKQAKKMGLDTVYETSFANDGDSLELCLCYAEMEKTGSDYIACKSGGY